MNANPKRPKKVAANSDEYEDEDRLSSFPDGILCHILSLMPTKNAARTSVLSKRWRCMFLGVPKIDLQDSTRASLNPNADFIHFVSTWLMLCMTSCLNEFRLSCERLPEAHVMELWLRSLLVRNLKLLQIKGPSNPNLPRSPLNLRRFETLVVLKLSGYIMVLHIPETFRFPNLKVLALEALAVLFHSENLSFCEGGFPQLEDLSLQGIRFPNKRKCVLVISLLNLRILLIIWNCLPKRMSGIDIDTPHLRDFTFKVDSPRVTRTRVNLGNFECLESADLHIKSELFESPSLWFAQLFSKVNKVRELKLVVVIGEDFSLTADSLCAFPNLASLEIYTNRGFEWILLRKAPNLTKLNWKMGCDLGEYTYEPEPKCFAENLREVQISNFEEDKADELALVKYFLEHVAALERMIMEGAFCYKVQKKKLSTLLQHLKDIRPCSRACEIELIGRGSSHWEDYLDSIGPGPIQCVVGAKRIVLRFIPGWWDKKSEASTVTILPWNWRTERMQDA